MNDVMLRQGSFNKSTYLVRSYYQVDNLLFRNIEIRKNFRTRNVIQSLSKDLFHIWEISSRLSEKI